MIFYLDTSLLVAALTREAKSEEALDWLGRQAAGSLFVSDWVTTEFSSALSLKLRSNELNLEHRASAQTTFGRLCAESLTVLPLKREQFRAAAHFVGQHALVLRAGDALHLAVCADVGATLATLDRRLAEAGPRVGVSTLLL